MDSSASARFDLLMNAPASAVWTFAIYGFGCTIPRHLLQGSRSHANDFQAHVGAGSVVSDDHSGRSGLAALVGPATGFLHMLFQPPGLRGRDGAQRSQPGPLRNGLQQVYSHRDVGHLWPVWPPRVRARPTLSPLPNGFGEVQVRPHPLAASSARKRALHRDVITRSRGAGAIELRQAECRLPVSAVRRA